MVSTGLNKIQENIWEGSRKRQEAVERSGKKNEKP